MSLYEGMFLIDNDAVRAGWASAKANVTDLVTKHGGKVHTSRRWDERRLAYAVKKRNRATYLRAYYEIASERIPAFVRDLEINERVLRYLLLGAEAVPADEVQAAQAEETGDFIVPEPPSDDVLDPEPVRGSGDDDDDDDDDRPRRRRAPRADDDDVSRDDDRDDSREPVAAQASGKSEKGGEG